MKIFFPQWQGAGSGSIIEEGATALLNYLGKDNFLDRAEVISKEIRLVKKITLRIYL